MITLISVTTGILSIILVSIFFANIIKAQRESSLKKHRKVSQGFSDLLNYASIVDNGVMICKNGSFLAAWIYKGSDNESSTDNQRDQTSSLLNKALSGLGNGWMIHVDAVRKSAPGYPNPSDSKFPDPISRFIDDERRNLFQNIGVMYEGYFVVTLTWFPPLLIQSQFVDLMFDDDKDKPTKLKRSVNLINEFKREIAGIENKLSTALKLTRLKCHTVVEEDGREVRYDDLLAWINFCVTGKNHPIVLPNNPMYIDNLIAQEFCGGVVPKIGKKFIQVVSIDGFALESHPGILSALSDIPTEYRWSSRFIFMDQHEALNHLEKFRKKWRQKVRGFYDQVFNSNSTKVDHDALDMVNDVDGAIAEVNSGLVAMGYYTSTIILMDENREKLEQATSGIEKNINKLGFSARTETVNTIDAYLGSLPGHGVENVRRPLINTLNLSDFLPTNSIWTGAEHAPCPNYPTGSPALIHAVTSGSTPFRLNLHVRDLGHTIMLGPTRSGKSTHLALIAVQARRYQGMTLFSFDKGMSMYPVTKAVGGKHFSVASDDSKLAFCPLQYLDTKGDRAWAMEWVDTILTLNGLISSPHQRNEIGNAIISMYKSGAKTLSEFVLTIQDSEIRGALKQYTVDGMMGHLLDAEEDGLELTDFTTFEIEDLMDLGEKYALPVLLYLFRRIEKALNGQPAMIILDEAWIMLGHPVFREKIRDWLKAYAKKNCLVLMATQSLTDAQNSGIFDVIVESTATKIFLPNINAREEEATALYKRMGLNNKQIEIISSAIPKRQYYCVSESGRRLYELALGPAALAFVGATDKDSIAEIKDLERRCGKRWKGEWLNSKGVTSYKEMELEGCA